ncbi:MAG TPA: DUF6526 family protein [Verrucomicrobiae bacterium]|nr:DUF6526 family protein [Verrucomicrobiae bacterium]
MANQKPQNLKNHVRLVPLFHMFVLPVFLINLVGSIVHLVRAGISYGSVLGVLMALAFFVLAFFARVFALTVQDRVIRLEMRQRLAEVLPVDLRPRIPEFNVAQLVSLRFASDAELPALARKVLDEKLDNRKAIKQLIKDWQGDYLRA